MKIISQETIIYSRIKKYLLTLFLWLSIINQNNGQSVFNKYETNKNLEYIGLTARIIDYMPFELNYVNLKNNNGIGVSFGYGKYKTINHSNNHYLGNSKIIFPNISHEAYIVKLRYLNNLKFNEDKDKLRYISFNLISSYANYSYFINYTDQLYGNETYKKTKNCISLAAEAEFGKIQELLIKNLIFSYGFSIGFKIFDPYLDTLPNRFENYINHLYMPGAGFGLLLFGNMNVAIGYVL
jgi:hypothetical protein